MLKNNKKRKASVLGGAIMLALLSANAFADNKAASLLYPPDAVVAGKRLNQWSAEWWQYIYSIPSKVNPLLDTSGGLCTIVQHGSVWFLEGTAPGASATERKCSIPEGVALFFPLVNISDINVATQPVTELRAEIAGCINAAHDLSLSIDGKAIDSRTLRQLRTLSVPFSVTVPDSDLPTTPPISANIYSPGVDDGYYAMVKPLPVGDHTIHLTGASSGCNYAPTGFVVPAWSVDVTYKLTVKPVTLH